MEGPANTINYFIAGYLVIFGIMAGYVASLAIRWNNLKQDVAVLEDLKEKEGEK